MTTITEADVEQASLVLRDSDLLSVLSEARGRRPALMAFSRLLRVAEGNE